MFTNIWATMRKVVAMKLFATGDNKLKRISIVCVILLVILSGCIPVGTTAVEMPVDFKQREQIGSFEVNSDSTTITIGMIGDILLHHPLYTYDNYDFAFEQVKEKLTGIDFLLANQESMPGGVELGLSGYPSFNSPKHIIRDLKANGVNMLSIANNHTIDRRETGLLKTIDHMNEYDMPYIGAYTSFEDQAKDRIVDINGVRIGVLAYTFSTNGIPVPKGKEYLVSLIDRDRMREDIAKLTKLSM